MDSAPIVVISFFEKLVAFNLYTGQHVWEVPMPPAGSARLMVDQGMVFYAPDLNLYCLDYQTGALRWKVPTGIEFGSPNMFLYSGCLLLASSGQFSCFNVQTGGMLWSEKSGSAAKATGNAIAAPGASLQIDRVGHK